MKGSFSYFIIICLIRVVLVLFFLRFEVSVGHGGNGCLDTVLVAQDKE